MDNHVLRRQWLPKDEAELLAAYRDGTLTENTWCDLKREVGSSDGARIELARDIASFSVYGGTVIVGIDEKEPDGDPLHPVPLHGLRERIQQVANTRIDPPLRVVCVAIPTEYDADLGYVLVHIPASALAPHQVQGVYYGRADAIKRKLPDAEVEALHRRRAQWTQDASALLERHVAADLFADTQRKPHLFLVARPVGAEPEMCRDLVSGQDWRQKLAMLARLVAGDPALHAVRSDMFPGQLATSICGTLAQAHKSERGAVLSNSIYLPPHDAISEDQTTTLEIGEDGEIRFFHSSIGEPQQFNSAEFTVLYLDLLALIVRDVLAVAREVSQRAGHAARWELGLAVTGIAGARPRSTDPRRMDPAGHPGYPGREYRHVAHANVLDLERAPGAVAERLAGPLLRRLDIDDRAWFTTPFRDADEGNSAETS